MKTQQVTFVSHIDQLFERLDAEGKLHKLPDEQVRQIRERVSGEMNVFRLELRKKQAQSIADAEQIILGG